MAARIVGQPVTVYWGDGNLTLPLEDKPAPDFGYNFQMYAAGYAYSVKVEGLPSDILNGAGMGDTINRFKGIHTSYYVTFQPRHEIAPRDSATQEIDAIRSGGLPALRFLLAAWCMVRLCGSRANAAAV